MRLSPNPLRVVATDGLAIKMRDSTGYSHHTSAMLLVTTPTEMSRPFDIIHPRRKTALALLEPYGTTWSDGLPCSFIIS